MHVQMTSQADAMTEISHVRYFTISAATKFLRSDIIEVTVRVMR